MALLFADSLGDVQAQLLWRDPHGRGLAVRACIHQRPTIIIAFHADNKAADGQSADVRQAESYKRLMAAIPHDRTYQYIWMLDANNFVIPRLDYTRWSAHGTTIPPDDTRHPLGVSAMNTCLMHWGGLRDAFRALHPGAVAYTRRNVISVNQATREPTSLSRSRIDRIYVSPPLTTNGSAPKLRSLVHITPTDIDLVAVRRTGSTSKWSDHSAVQATIQYSNVARPRPNWSVPRHLLADPAYLNTQLRPLAARTAAEDKDGRDRLRNFLREARASIIAREQKDSRDRGLRMHYVRSCLRVAYRQVGTDVDSTGTLHAIDTTTIRPEHVAANIAWIRTRIAFVTWRRQRLEEDLLDLQMRKQRQWLRNRGYEEFRTSDVCCRAFFEDARSSKTYSHIDYLLDAYGNKITTMPSIFKQARVHFGGDGAIFNLHTGTHPSQAQQADVDAKRQTLLEALTADGKVLSDAQKQSLDTAAVFTPENVQCAIDSLQANTSPGTDGFTSEFFRTIGQREVDPETKKRMPCPLAHILADAFSECVANGRMLPCMRRSVVSLIFKNKGKRHDLSKYRPIAVASLIYRIMAKTVVVAMSPVLPTITSDCQKAFKPDELIGDATRLTQDVIQYCNTTGTPGFIVFADQDNAYPRVRWEYLFDVMRTMNFPPSFINIVRTMYTDIQLRFKINGVTDKEHITPSNGLAQGCPLSPCLYLLCIQGLISLMHVDSLKPEGIKGIPIPAGDGGGPPAPLLTSAFADDVCIFLESVRQLTRFKELLHIYCIGAGALNSWEKTVGLRVGDERESDDLPTGWTEGIDINTHPTLKLGSHTINGIIRYLGIFLGTPDAVAEAWVARTSERISDRAAQWRLKRMPQTRDGRAIALRNSILAQAWYLIEHQVPPNLSDMLQQWRTDEWVFFANHNPIAPPGPAPTPMPPTPTPGEPTTPDTTRSPSATQPTNANASDPTPVPQRRAGSTNVKQITLIQDHAEGGKRVTDVETFVTSLHIRRIRHMLEPNSGPHTNFIMFWLQEYYGHLRQGLRLLLSQCDFLRIVATPTESKCAPPLWRLTLKATGCMRGLTPAVSQEGANPHAHYPLTSRTTSIDGSPRTVNIKTTWSIGESAMEPLFYNPNMGGWWGAPLTDPADWEVDDRESHPRAASLRWSKEKECRSRDIDTTSRAFAAWDITHFMHLLTGTGAGEELRIATYRDIIARRAATPPFSAHTYQSLLDAIPHQWTQAVKEATTAKQQDPTATFRQIVDRTPLPPGSWVQGEDGRVGWIDANGPWALHAFSGKAGRLDGLAACLQERGMRCTEVDTLIDAKKHDLLNDSVYARILSDAEAGRYSYGCFGVPCSTFSIVRSVEVEGTKGATVVRNRDNIKGLPDLPPPLQRQVDRSNELVRRTVTIARAIVLRGGDVCFENPCDRGGYDDEDSVVRSLYQEEWRTHGPLWKLPIMKDMKRDLNLHAVTFPQCALGGRFQKYTTLWYSPRLAPVLDCLSACTCTHDKHAEVAKGRNQAHQWRSAEAAAYPTQLNSTLADAALAAASQQTQRNHEPSVLEWFSLNHKSQLTSRDRSSITRRDQLGKHRQVHVWTQEALAHSKEEQAWRDRHPDESASPIQWCGGGVIDWNLLDNQRTQSSGAVNPGDWAWAFNPTDRARPPISVASADVFHIYNLRLSYLHSPPRTFDLEQVHTPTAADSTSWANLLDPTLADTDTHTEHIVSRILDARTCTDNSTEYLVRWYGHSADSDTWVSSRTVKDTNAFERFCHTERPGNNDAGAARQWLRKRDSNPSDDSGSPPPTWLAPSAWAYSEVYDAVTPVESPLTPCTPSSLTLSPLAMVDVDERSYAHTARPAT